MTIKFSIEDDYIRASFPGPDVVDRFSVEDLRQRYERGIQDLKDARIEINEAVDLMYAVNTSKDIEIMIKDIPERLKKPGGDYVK